MAESWAKGSGSTWEPLEGDPRIVVGAEVLIGRRLEGEAATGSHMIGAYFGLRRTVAAERRTSRAGHRIVSTNGSGHWTWRARDLVCLRLATGELTEEGRALEHLSSWDGHSFSEKELSWLFRAGIIVDRNNGNCWRVSKYWVDSRRLDMALGMDETKASTYCHEPKSKPITLKMIEDAYHEIVEAHRTNGAPSLECAHCSALAIPGRAYCADHHQIADEEEMPRRDPPATPPVDYSGESHMDALRSWIRRPMGTR